MKTNQLVGESALDDKKKESKTLIFSLRENHDETAVKIHALNSTENREKNKLMDSSIEQEDIANIYKHFF
jgi:hypothetical protein